MDANTHTQGFWQRQISPEVTPQQIAFDVIFGILVPILALVFDPIVFRGYYVFLAPFRIFAYVAIALGTIALALWLRLFPHLSRWSGFFAGIFFAGEVFALLLGLALLPLSLPGLLVLIGILGLIPFVTSFVFYRNSKRARRLAQASPARVWQVGSFLLGILLVIGVPAATHVLTNRFVSQSVDDILAGDPQTAQSAALRLKSAFWCDETCYVDITWAYERETDGVRRQILRQAYEQITGQDIESVLGSFTD
jgi:hypothetical protein